MDPEEEKEKEREQGSRDSESSLLREKEGMECFLLLFAFSSDVLTISLTCYMNNSNIAHVDYREYRLTLTFPAFYENYVNFLYSS